MILRKVGNAQMYSNSLYLIKREEPSRKWTLRLNGEVIDTDESRIDLAKRNDLKLEEK